jgi:hypothetical protein
MPIKAAYGLAMKTLSRNCVDWDKNNITTYFIMQRWGRLPSQVFPA